VVLSSNSISSVAAYQFLWLARKKVKGEKKKNFSVFFKSFYVIFFFKNNHFIFFFTDLDFLFIEMLTRFF